MATTAVNNSVNPYAALNGATGGAGAATANEAASADRFLKLLVTQLQNQDPLNPMDNAQVTSQMAQINTVTGVEKLNTTMEGLNTQFVQMQAVTGASLVGRDVTVQGNRLSVASGVGVGGFELNGTASTVKVEVLNAAGRVLDTLDLGTQTAGRHAFNWDAAKAGVADGADHRFRVTATNGTTAVSSTPLMLDRVQAVSSSGNKLVIETQYSGSVDYSDVKAFN